VFFDYSSIIIGTKVIEMKMTTRVPETWMELQELVAYYFNNAGYAASTPLKINTVRGDVEVDVFIAANGELGDTAICECKYWNSPIPQEKIHAFRTVVVDSGVSLGIIISKSGFQSGAIDAAKKSNIKLFTWVEFLSFIFAKWFSHRKKQLLNNVKPLIVYTDPLDIPFNKLTTIQQEGYERILTDNKYLILDCVRIDEESIKFFEKRMNYCINSYEEYFDILEHLILSAIEAYNSMFKELDIPKDKFDFDVNLVFDVMGSK
jgi:hypothetical protein